jgi:branched-chain amino acid transport system permease protein
MLGFVALSLVIVRATENSRFGAYLVAIRENEDAASALGINVFAVKLAAITISAAMTAAAGCFYAQYFLFIDAAIAYGPWISIDALLAPIVGGAGTLFAPLLGAFVIKSLGEATRLLTADAPGVDLVIYGLALIAVIGLSPRGFAGLLSALSRWRFGVPVKPERGNA